MSSGLEFRLVCNPCVPVFFWSRSIDHHICPDEFTIREPYEPFTQVTTNVGLERLTLRGPPYILVEVAPYLLKQTHFAPELTVLNLDFDDCHEEEIPCLDKFEWLDEAIHTRPSLHKVRISSTSEETWEEVRSYATEYMDCWEKKGILELELKLKK